MDKINIKFYIEQNYYNALADLPWYLPLEEWENSEVHFLEFRKGLSRHPVKFIKKKGYSFAIKQTTEKSAQVELKNYEKLLSIGIHSLIPIGYIVCERPPIIVETKVGNFFENDDITFIITMLEDKALPDSYLYRLNFKDDNKKIIWNAIAQLFATLHFNNIYWGDASLANLLVRFFKNKDEFGRVKTELKAILADAETVQLFTKISDELRKNDLEFFFESMEWIKEDLKISGNDVKYLSTTEEKKYILKQYRDYYLLLNKIKKFESLTDINVKKVFGNIQDVCVLDSIYKQIEEHKWYLSEDTVETISLKDTTLNWLNTIYYPIIKEIEKTNILKYFPFKSAADLYKDIMVHKYYLSEAEGYDVGVEKAILDYASKFAPDPSFDSLIKKIIKIMFKLVPKL